MTAVGHAVNLGKLMADRVWGCRGDGLRAAQSHHESRSNPVEKPVRRILLLLFLLAVSASATANVSLGEIEVRSFLNQPLQAQFRVQGSTLAGTEVEVRVASEEAYRRAGLLRTAIPADLNIAVEGTGTTRTVRVTTMRPVREPYLGLLLEARWPAGRVLREYTILLDPPVAFAPERSAPPVITRAPEPVVRAAPAPVPAPVARSERPTPPASRYTVRRGDTLSAIVRRQGYSGVTDQQAMLAIRDANPNAFVGGNINQLRAGVELRLPTQSEVAAYGREEALLEFRRQNAEWRGQVAPPVVAEPAPEPAREPAAEVIAEPEALPAPETQPEVEPTPEVEPVAEAETVAPAEEPAAVEPTPAPEPEPLATEVESTADRLEILGESEFDPAVVADSGTQLIEEAMLAQQAAMRELRDELNMLRTELGERDQLIRVMNTELAQLEARMQNLREQRDEGAPGLGADTPLHTRLLSDPLLLLLSATSLLLFLLLVLAVFRSRGRERAAEVPMVPAPAVGAPRKEPTAAPAADPAPAPAAPAAATAAALGATAVAGAASAAAEKRESGTTASAATPPRKQDSGDDAKVEDILADVDLYLAYGMNDQAITALEKAIRGGQDDPEYRVRLIEAYAANGDGAAVHREAETLLERLEPGQQALRERVDAALANVPAADSDAGLDDPGLNPDAMDVAAPGESAAEDAQRQPDAAGSDDSQRDDNLLEFDLGDELEITGAAGTSKSDAAAAPDADRETEASDPGLLRFDLGDDDSAVGPPAERPAADGEDGRKDEAEAFPELTLPDLEPLEPLEPLTPAAPQAPAESMAESDGDTSENGMKLSLAEAFVEMGDREGAIALLDEILPSATDAQRAKAEALRRQIEGGGG